MALDTGRGLTLKKLVTFTLVLCVTTYPVGQLADSLTRLDLYDYVGAQLRLNLGLKGCFGEYRLYR